VETTALNIVPNVKESESMHQYVNVLIITILDLMVLVTLVNISAKNVKKAQTNVLNAQKIPTEPKLIHVNV